MATNFLENIDSAFLRRINFIINFPFPNTNMRQKIWENIFPHDAPLANTIDFKYLAKSFELSGGNIKNIVLEKRVAIQKKRSKI
jgi:ATP-dependent 26S proteasome regulatory subunit